MLLLLIERFKQFLEECAEHKNHEVENSLQYR